METRAQRKEMVVAGVIAIAAALSLAGVVGYAFPPAVTTRPVNTGSPIPVASLRPSNVSIGGSPRTVAINPNTARAYVADWFTDSLTVVDTTTDSVVARITLPAANNNGIVIDDNTSLVYVLVAGGVAVVNGTSNKVVGEFPLDFGAGSLAYDQSTHVIYGSPQTGNASLVGFNVQTGKIVMSTQLGYWADSVTVNTGTHVVFAAGCSQEGGLVCGTVVSAVNGITGQILVRIPIGNGAYPRLALNQVTGVVYVSGSAQLVALNGTTGSLVYAVNSEACGPFDSLVVNPSSNQLLGISLDYHYTFAYNGTSGALVDMYSFPSTPQYISFNPNTLEAYVTLGSQLLAFQTVSGIGNFNGTLVGSGQNCPLP
jgi:YVTN family beta-propeller protein